MAKPFWEKDQGPIGALPDGKINVGPPDVMRKKWKLWQAQQEAAERGEDPTLLPDPDTVVIEPEERELDPDVDDLHDYDDLL